MAAVRDFYRVLGVRRSAATAEIKAAFRKKAQLYHPDHNPGKEDWAGKRLKSVVEAYEVLCDPERRRLLDRQLALKRQASVQRDVARRPGRRTVSENQIIVDIMRHRATPVWARTAAFAYIFMQYYSRER